MISVLAAIILNTEITDPSNYRSLKHFDLWMKKNRIVGITGLDTRNLTNFIRDKGAPKGSIAFSKNGNFDIKQLTDSTIKWSGLKNLDLAHKVSTKKNYSLTNKLPKHNIVRKTDTST